MQKATVLFEGKAYKVRRKNTAVPDLASMERMAALLWLLRNTYPRGYSKAEASSLAFGGAIAIS